MNQRNLVFGGSVLLLAGLFCPVASLPSSVALYTASPIAVGLAALAVACVMLVLNGREKDLIYPAAAAGALLAYAFVRIDMALSDLRLAMAPLQSAALLTVQLRWGWLVLALGAGVLIYAAVVARREGGALRVKPEDPTARIVLGLAVALLAATPAFDLVAKLSERREPASLPAASLPPPPAVAPADGPTVTGEAPDKDAQAYIAAHLKLYDLTARYYESVLDGRLPGVDFKIKNDGDRTLTKIEVRVVFYDENDKPISEENYFPVLVNEYSDGKPLKPNYIWQQESGKFFSAKNVPSEWKTGKVTATIVGVEFGPGE